MRKLTKASLSELAESKEIISFLEQKSYVGGGSGTTTDPYTQNEFETIVGNGNWAGGYVLGLEEKNGELSYTGGTDLTPGYIESYNGKTQIPQINGNGTSLHPYTEKQFDDMYEKGTWNGGFVEDMGYVLDDVTCISYDKQKLRNSNRMTGDPLFDTMYENGYDVGFKAGVTEDDCDDYVAVGYSGISSILANGGTDDDHPEMYHQAIGIIEGLNAGREAIGKSKMF